MISVDGLTKSYAAIRALKGITFRVEPGEVVGFLGPNGAGKTTTLRILSGYMPATEGAAEIAGFDVFRRSREVRRRTGYLPEDVPLYRDMTVTDFLRYLGGLKDIPGPRLNAEIERVVGLTGLEPVRGLLLSKCSKGYRQRTGLAQALLGDPQVLLLDEPTSGLDPNQVVEVRDLIRHLSGEKTVLLSSHILSEVTHICSRVLIIHQGRLVASGTPADLARRYGTGTRIRLRVRGAVDPARLGSVKGVARAVEEGAGEFRLEVTDAEGTAPRLAEAVLAAGAALVELRHETADLESIFRAATEGDADA
jgi:ABC-2 type transport system ATP-binding protein